jgi:hypothetical protein
MKEVDYFPPISLPGTAPPAACYHSHCHLFELHSVRSQLVVRIDGKQVCNVDRVKRQVSDLKPHLSFFLSFFLALPNTNLATANKTYFITYKHIYISIYIV